MKCVILSIMLIRVRMFVIVHSKPHFVNAQYHIYIARRTQSGNRLLFRLVFDSCGRGESALVCESMCLSMLATWLWHSV